MAIWAASSAAQTSRSLRARVGVEQVRPDRVVEHVGVLGDVADDVLQRLERDVADVVAPDPDRASVDVVEPSHEVGDRGLARAGGTDERDHLAGLGDERDVVEDLDVVTGLDAGDRLERGERDVVGLRVGEGDVVELEAGGVLGQREGARLLLDQAREVEHLEDPVEADQRRHHVDADVGQRLQRPQQPDQQGAQGDQGADRQVALDREVAADAVDEGGGQRREQGHRGEEDAGEQGDAYAEVTHRPARTANWASSVSRLPNSFSSIAPPTLNRSVIMLPRSALPSIWSRVSPASRVPTQREVTTRIGGSRQAQHGHLPAQRQHGRPDHHDRDDVGDRAGQGRGEGALRADDVVVEPRDQCPGLGAGEERQRLALDMAEDPGAQVEDQPLTDPRGQVAADQA